MRWDGHAMDDGVVGEERLGVRPAWQGLKGWRSGEVARTEDGLGTSRVWV